MKKENITGGLHERAMLVDLSISRWRAKASDRTATREVAEKHKVGVGMGEYKKLLVAKEALAKVRSLATEARAIHKFHTLPWNDSGCRILSAAGYFAYAEAIRKVRERFDEATVEFMVEYRKHVTDAKKLLGDLFDEGQYPKDEAALRARFAIDIRILPFPAAEDFRVKLSRETVETVRSQIQADLQKTMQVAMQDVWGRVHAVVAHMAERLQAYKVTKKGVENSFRDSLVTNIKELLDVLPSLNVTGDPQLDAVAEEMRAALLPEPTVLRDDEKVRSATAKAADRILKKMEAFI